MRESKDENIDERDPDESATLDPGLALVVAASPVTRIVVSSIAERAGLRTHSSTPGQAQPLIAGRLPAIALLAGGADSDANNQLMEQLAALRRPAGRTQAPFIVFLANSNSSRPMDDMADIVMAKPVTLDRLHPIIRDLMDRLKG